MKKIFLLISVTLVFAFLGCDIIKIKKKDDAKKDSNNVEIVAEKKATEVVAQKPDESTEKELKLTEEVNALHAVIAELNTAISDKNNEIVKLRGDIDGLNNKVTELNISIEEMKKMQQILYIVIIASLILIIILIASLIKRRKSPKNSKFHDDEMPISKMNKTFTDSSILKDDEPKKDNLKTKTSSLKSDNTAVKIAGKPAVKAKKIATKKAVKKPTTK